MRAHAVSWFVLARARRALRLSRPHPRRPWSRSDDRRTRCLSGPTALGPRSRSVAGWRTGTTRLQSWAVGRTLARKRFRRRARDVRGLRRLLRAQSFERDSDQQHARASPGPRAGTRQCGRGTRITGGARRFEPEKIAKVVAIGPLAYRAAQHDSRSRAAHGRCSRVARPLHRARRLDGAVALAPAADAVQRRARGTTFEARVAASVSNRMERDRCPAPHARSVRPHDRARRLHASPVRCAVCAGIPRSLNGARRRQRSGRRAHSRSRPSKLWRLLVA